MRVVVLALALALVAGHNQNLAPYFAPGNTYVYKYETEILGGLPEQGLARAGFKLVSQVKISAAATNMILLQLENPQIFEYSDVWPKQSFSHTRLTAALEAQLQIPIKFEYNNGIVSKIHAPESVPTLVLNIHRGVLSFLQMNIKQTQNVYELQEEGAQGVCKTQYAITEDEKAGRILLTRSRNLNHCQEKVIKDIGLAYTRTCMKCQEISKSLRGTTGYNYKLKEVPNGVLIEEALGNEVIQFTPFHELNGAAMMKTMQRLVFVQIARAPIVPINAEYRQRGSLKYEFSTELLKTPIRFMQMTDVREQIPEVLTHLVTHNEERVHEDAPMNFLKLIELLRAADSHQLRTQWNAYARKPLYRQWLLDAIPYIGTREALELVKEELEKEELSIPQATQLLIGSLHLLEPTSDMIRQVWNIIQQKANLAEETIFKRVVRKTLLLGYGSLIHRHCAGRAECHEEDIRRIQVYFDKAYAEKNIEEIVLLTKVMANAAHPWSFKTITKLLPIHGTDGANLPRRVHVEAILALKSIAKLKAKEVQNLALQLYMDKTLHQELRILAVMVLFETKPSMAVLTNVVNTVKYDPSLPVASFTHSLIKSLARSINGVHTSVAAECNVALKLLSRRTLNMKLSNAFHMDYYSHPLMLGTAASIYCINDAATILPKTVVAKTSAYFAGVAADVFEINVRSEGFQEYFLQKDLNDVSDRITKMRNILKAFSNWKALPVNKLLGSLSIKIMGQEVAFADIDKQVIDEAVKLSSEIDIKQYGINILHKLIHNGFSTHIVKAMLPTAMRKIMPTAAGLPMELALYTSAVTVADVHVSINSNLPQHFNLPNILTAKMDLQSVIKPSINLNTFAIMGVNTDIAQAAMVLRAKVNVSVPAKIEASLDFKENNFKISALPVNLPENVALGVDVETLAIARFARRTTPLIPEQVPNIMPASTSTESSTHSSQERTDNMQAQNRLGYKPKAVNKKFCASAIGMKSCLKFVSTNAVFIRDSALYKLVGKHSIDLSVRPAESDVVERLEMEVQLGPNAAKKLIKQITLDMEEIPGSGPIVSKLKRILTPDLRNSSSSSSSSRSRVRHSPRSHSSSASSSSSSSKSHITSRVISAVGKIIGVKSKHRSSSSSSSSSSRSHKSHKSTVSSLGSLFSASSSSSQSVPHSQHKSSHKKFEPNHQKRTSKRQSGSASTASSFEAIRTQNKFLGDSTSPFFVIILRAIRADNKLQGYQIAAYKDRAEARIQMIMAALAPEDNWKLCVDGIALSKSKVSAKITWGEKYMKYDTTITAETGLVQTKMAARVRVAWKRLPTAVVKHVKMLYERILVPYLSSNYLQKRMDVTKQISFTVVVESEKVLNLIFKSPACVYRRVVPLPIVLPCRELKGLVPFDEVLENIRYILAKTTAAECRFDDGHITTFNHRRYKNYMPNSCYQLLAQDCTDRLRFIILLKKDSPERYMITVKIGTKDIDMFLDGHRVAVRVNGQEIATDNLPYIRDSVKIDLQENKLVLLAPKIGIAELHFSNRDVMLRVLDSMRNQVCGLCGQGNGDIGRDYLTPNGRVTDNSISFAHSWTLPSQSCDDENGCRLKHTYVELERNMNVHGVESQCSSVEPVLRCLPGCRAIKTTMTNVGFHCKPIGNSQVTDVSESRIDMRQSVEAHLDCSCNSQCA